MTTLSLCPAVQATSHALLVLGVATDPQAPRGLRLLAPGLGLAATSADGLAASLAEVGATGKVGELVRAPGSPLDLPPVLAVGLGSWPEVSAPGQPALPPESLVAETLRRAAGAALLSARAGRVAVALPASTDAEVEAVGLGALLGAYRYQGARAADPASPTPQVIDLVVPPTGDPGAAVRRASVIGAAVNLARQLVDTPPGNLPPAALADAAIAALDGCDVAVEVLDEIALADQGFGGILAVGQGSANPPRLVRLAYAPPVSGGHLALVGKGITFDSGGLSLKPPASMVTMKCDMAGAAAVLAAVQAIAALQLPVTVTAYLAIAENMPSGSAQRPGDVITAYSPDGPGRTVEVLNTDAEGRLVMMDALGRAGADHPDRLVDVATLTGAQVVALGARIAGIMGNDDTWRAAVAAAAARAGELAWQMPIPEEMRPSLDSPVADLANIGEKNGSMMTAAAFLREFVPAGLPWAHIDIAGPAFNEGGPWAYNAKGATGFAVRTLIALAEGLPADL